MTFDELIDDLPNGFHDAHLNEIEVSYLKRVVVLHATVDVTEDGLGRYVRDLKVTLSGVAFFVIEPPDRTYPLAKGKLRIDAGAGAPSTSDVALPEPPSNTKLNWIFVNEWNSFIRFASEACRHEWTSEKRLFAAGA